MLESKHGIIRSIFLRLIDASPSIARTLAELQAMRISNDLYGSSTPSAFEMARDFIRPLHGSPVMLPDELFLAQSELHAKRKLTRILQSKSVADSKFTIGELVEVFIKGPRKKRGKWSSPRTVLEYDPSSWTVTVPSSKGRTMKAAIEDIPYAVPADSLSDFVRRANDELDE